MITETKEVNLKEWVKTTSDIELEIFVRRRLGQENPELRETRKDHVRLSFHSPTWKDHAENYRILSLFQDCFDLGDHSHAPIIYGYKGTLSIYPVSNPDEPLFETLGEGTVRVIMNLLRKMPIDGYYNAHP